MSFTPRYLASLLLVAAGGAASIVPVPTAAADGMPPISGDESASTIIDDLQAQGYNVAINYTNGQSNMPLSICRVTAIHNPDGAPSQGTLSTVYVDVLCPNHEDEGGVGIGGGIGGGIG